MQGSLRDRLTIDMRGMGPRLHAHAASSGRPVAALVRGAVATLLGAEPTLAETGRPDVPATHEGPDVKVTLRLPPAHALLLARRARAAELSQGAYVACLIESQPAHEHDDHRRDVAALMRSTDQLAALATDLSALIRLLERNSSGELERFRCNLSSLVADVRSHLVLAAGLAAAVRPVRRKS
jgi:hypothetical protein